MKHATKPATKPGRAFRSLVRRVWLGIALAVALFAGVTASGDWSDRQRAVGDAFALTSNVAQALDQEVRRLLASVDMVFAAASVRVDAHAAGASRDNTVALLDALLRRAPALTGLRVLDGSTGSRLFGIGRDGGEDEALVRRVVGEGGDVGTGLVIGAPVGDGAGGWSVAVARRVVPRDGETPLIAIADLSLAELQALYGRFQLGPRGSVFLLRGDGALLVRHPYAASNVGRVFAPADLALDDRPTAQRLLEGAATADGAARFVSARRLDPLPLIVGVTQAADDALAPWRRELAADAATVAAVALVLAGLGAALTRALARRERLEAETRATATHLAATLETMDQGLVVLDPDGTPRLHNRRAAELLGPALATLDRAGDVPGRRTERPGAGGRVLEVHTATMADGGVVRTFSDVTERKCGEALLASAKEEAERASAAKSDFLASMSHEIRTPLNGVLGYADLLLDDPTLSPRQQGHARHIQAAGSALLTVLDDVLDFSAIEAGRVALAPRPFDPRALAEEACAIVRGLSERKGLALGLSLDPALPAALVGDADRLRQVLLNLLNNAVKFTARGRVELALARCPRPRPPAEGPPAEAGSDGAGAEDKAEGRAEGRAEAGAGAGAGWCGLSVSVSDTGIGIAPDKQARLFERFSQLDGSIRREFGGTGLGLAISQRLVGLMGGRIGVESAPGAGSTFGFVLGLPVAAGVGAEAAGSAGPVAGGGARVLLVEDLAINQELARAVLEGAGHAVEVVGDGAAAVAAVSAARGGGFDVVLMDVQMPGLDGLAATRAIRGLGGVAGRVPIVGLTANVLPGQLAACRAAGMDDHVGKPFRRGQLLEAVARWSHGRAEPADAAEPTPESDGVLDPAVYADLREMLGDEPLLGLMERLVDDLARRFADAEDRGRLAADAHALVSTAGMLGFTAFARLCAEFEEACRDAAAPQPNLAAIRQAGAAVAARVDSLRRAA